jgi:hypothetical protein
LARSPRAWAFWPCSNNFTGSAEVSPKASSLWAAVARLKETMSNKAAVNNNAAQAFELPFCNGAFMKTNRIWLEKNT